MRTLFLLLIFYGNVAYCSDSIQEPYYLSLRIKGGYLAAHRSTMAHLATERIFAVELSYKKRLMGSRYWHNSYKNPFIGTTLYASNLGNKEVLGNAVGFYGFIEFPWFRAEKHIISCKMSGGFAYLTKTFDQQTNPKNVATSSHISAILVFGVTGHYFLNQKFGFEYGFDMTHFSNGSTKLPNLGLNIPTIRLGVIHKIGEHNSALISKEPISKAQVFSQKWNPTLIGICSFKEAWPTGGKKYAIGAVSALVFKQFRPKVGLELALDFISKQSLMDYKTYIPRNQWDIFQIGTYVGYAIPLQNFRFVTGMGYYLKDKFDADDELYHRLGVRYTFDNGLLLNFVLKTHWAKADYVEFGLGYNFKRK